MRYVTALFAGILVGGAVFLAFNPLSPFWAAVFGSASGFVAFGLALAWNSRGRTGGKVGWIVAAVTLGLFGAGTTLWIVGWGFSPFTLEGAWLYPLALGSFVLAAVAAKRARRSDALKLY